MVAFGHSSVGTLVGITAYQAFGNSDIALGLISTGFLGWLSHYLADFIPHGHFFRSMKNYERKIIWVIMFDLLLPIILLLSLAHFSGKGPIEILYLVFGIGGAQLPDVLDGLKRIDLLPKLKILKIENDFHMGTHWHGKEEQALLISFRDIWQIAVLILAIFILTFK